MDEIGMVYGTVYDISGYVIDVSDTLGTCKTICDMVEAALAAASVIPGAAAVTGPVISIYETIKPTLEMLISLTNMVSSFLKNIINVMQTADNVVRGKFDQLLNDGGITALNSMVA